MAVRGEVHREVDPEIATFTISVEARGRDRDAVLRLLAGRQERVRAVLDGYASAVEKQESSGIHVYPEGKKGSGEKVTAHNGNLQTTVTVADFAVLGPLMLALAGEEQVSVSGPWWALRPGSPAHRDARQAAIADALERAREYAAALSARIVRLIELADAGLNAQPLAGGGFRAMSLSEGAGDVPHMDLEPERQQVHASVEARFAISEPILK